MEKRNDRLFLSWARLCAAIFVVVVAIATSTAKADIPPAIEYNYAGTPIEQRMQQQGITMNGKQASINPQKAQAFTQANAPKQTASTDLKGHHTDTYGNKTPVNVKTETTLPKTSTYTKVGAAAMGGMFAGSALNSPYAKQGATEFANGNIVDAAANLAAALDVTGIGSGIYGLIDAYQTASAKKLLGDAQTAKVNKAAENYNVYGEVKIGDKVLQMADKKSSTVLYFKVKADFYFNRDTLYKQLNKDTMQGYLYGAPFVTYPNISGYGYIPNVITVTPANFETINNTIVANRPDLPAELLLTKDEIAAIIAPLLQSALDNQNANHKELINALWGLGALSKDNTQTQVMGTTQNNTFLSAPYTPAGSQQAQQTKVVIAPDGTVTTSVVARPDIAANTSQAPTRQEVGTQANTQTERPAKEGSTAEAPDICAKNPNSLMCMDMGNADYEDPIIPENKIDLKFEPSSIFKSDATCPAPKPFTIMNQTYAVEYQPMCDFALGARPMIIALGIFIAMGMAYATVKEL